MTRAPDDTPALWLLQHTPDFEDPMWSQALLPGGRTQSRAARPPHGEAAVCSGCGNIGQFDCGPTGRTVFNDSVWVNSGTGECECVDCFYK